MDLANVRGEVVEIDADGWRLSPQAPVKFIRAPGMLPLPNPVRDSQGWSRLRSLVNVGDEADYRLLVGVILAYLSGIGPFPVLLLRYNPGSGSTTLSRIVRALVDPNHAPLRGISPNERDLMISASNSWIIGLDNVPYMPQWLSSALCRLSTGAGFGTKRNYADSEEVLFQARRPVLVSGFRGIASQDLLDRAVVLTLPRISEGQRRTEDEFWSEVERDRPAILGCILDALSGALAVRSFYRPDELPRMADFAALIAAAEPFLPWELGQFEAAYTANRENAQRRILFSSPVARYVAQMASHQHSWSGTAGELLISLSGLATAKELRSSDWPQSPRAFSDILRRIASSLDALGITVTFRRESGGKRRRLVELRHCEEEE